MTLPWKAHLAAGHFQLGVRCMIPDALTAESLTEADFTTLGLDTLLVGPCGPSIAPGQPAGDDDGKPALDAEIARVTMAARADVQKVRNT